MTLFTSPVYGAASKHDIGMDLVIWNNHHGIKIPNEYIPDTTATQIAILQLQCSIQSKCTRLHCSSLTSSSTLPSPYERWLFLDPFAFSILSCTNKRTLSDVNHPKARADASSTFHTNNTHRTPSKTKSSQHQNMTQHTYRHSVHPSITSSSGDPSFPPAHQPKRTEPNDRHASPRPTHRRFSLPPAAVPFLPSSHPRG